MAETLADRNSYGFRPKRRTGDAIDPCFEGLRQRGSATGVLEGDIQGFLDPIALAWIEGHIPLNKRLVARGLRWGLSDRGARYPNGGSPPRGHYLACGKSTGC